MCLLPVLLAHVKNQPIAREGGFCCVQVMSESRSVRVGKSFFSVAVFMSLEVVKWEKHVRYKEVMLHFNAKSV